MLWLSKLPRGVGVFVVALGPPAGSAAAPRDCGHTA